MSGLRNLIRSGALAFDAFRALPPLSFRRSHGVEY